MLSYEKQSINLKGVSNARQLGGYIGNDGKSVRNNVILRTGTLYSASDEAMEALSKKYKVSDVIDLRMAPEVATMPDKKIENSRYHHISTLNDLPITEREFEIYKEAMKMPDIKKRYSYLYEVDFEFDQNRIYDSIVFGNDGVNGYKKIFEIFLSKNEDNAVLFHCTQGKDRTGVVAVLILSALGVDRETIIDDYLLTNIACANLLDKIKAELSYDKKVLDFALFLESVNIDFIKPALEKMDKEYGGAISYIKSELKLSDSDISDLRKLYLK